MESNVIASYYKLPLDLRQQVADFIEFLMTKQLQKRAVEKPEKDEPELKNRANNFGAAKGLIYMAPDFNDTPEDFKDYM